MVHNLEKLELATRFRKQGFSYTEIAKLCGVSKGTVSNWLAKKAFSKKVKKENSQRAVRENVKRIALLNKAKKKEREKRYLEVERSAKTAFKHYKSSPLFIAGLSVYLAQGDQSDAQTIRLSTSRMETHRIFIRFTREFLGIEKNNIHFWLLLSPAHSETASKKMWAKTLKISEAQFYKTQVIKGGGKPSALPYGVGNTLVYSAVQRHKLLVWIELLKKDASK